jgi:hypothetical protein
LIELSLVNKNVFGAIAVNLEFDSNVIDDKHSGKQRVPITSTLDGIIID